MAGRSVGRGARTRCGTLSEPGPDRAGGRYAVPSGRHRTEEVVRRSRFIATLAPAPDAEAALAVVRSIQAEFPDATHHCWAFVAGPPGSTRQVGMSDDGEPHGTAGRPILNALLHSGVGEVVAVVTRYYGGTKLGKGGLGRAYAGVVQRALGTLRTAARVTLAEVRVRVDFSRVDPLIQILDGAEARDRVEVYETEADVEVRARLPVDAIERVRREVAGLTQGAGALEVVGEAGESESR